MTKKNKIIIWLSMCIIIGLLIFFIVNTAIKSQREEELRVRRIELYEQIFYAETMFFVNNEHPNFVGLGPRVLRGDVLKSTGEEVADVVFVLSEEEAGGFPEGVIVVWPSEDTALFLERLNNNSNLRTLELEDFDISFPLELVDLVDNWELVNEIWMSSSSMQAQRRHFLNERRHSEVSEQGGIEEELTED